MDAIVFVEQMMIKFSQKEDLRIDSKFRSEGAHPLFSALSWRRLDQLSLSSLRGRKMSSDPCNYTDHEGGGH